MIKLHSWHSCAVFKHGVKSAIARDMNPERWRKVEEVYQSVMDCEPHLRSARLASICQGDEDLLREVESLLALNDLPVLVDEPAWHVCAELLENDSPVAVGTMLGP